MQLSNWIIENDNVATWLESICDTFDFPLLAKSELLNSYQKIKKEKQQFTQFIYTIKSYINDYKTNFSSMSEQIKTIAKKSGVNEYTAYTLFLICILHPLKDLYLKNNYPLKMWEEVGLDIKYKLLECYDVYGVFGTFVMSWFSRFFDLTKFCFGRLQMETITLNGNYLVNGVELKDGDTVLSVHIPKTGQPLDKNQVEESYRKAKAFYKDYFTSGYIVFTCSTYLMHPSAQSLINKDSNIYKFISDYDIVCYHDDEDYAELWRLFDCKINDKDFTQLPANTSLRKKFIDYMRTGQKIGRGFGIFVQK